MFKWFKKIFKRGDSNVKVILKKLLSGEALSEEEKAEAMKYVSEDTTENQESEPIDEKTDETVETETNEGAESTEEKQTEDAPKEEEKTETTESEEEPSDNSEVQPSEEEPNVEVPAVNPNAPNPGYDEQFSRFNEVIGRLEQKFDETVNALRKEVEDVRMLVVDQTKKPREVEKASDTPQYKRGFFDF